MAAWPGNPNVRIDRIQSIEQGDMCNLSVISMSAHTGTHMDAPLHFLKHGAPMERMPLTATVGPARVIPIRDKNAVTLAELRPHRIRRGERILFKTRNSAQPWHSGPFRKNFVYISTEAARFLADREIRAVGVDYLSLAGFEKNEVEAHQALLGAGVWIIEGLDLSRVQAGRYTLVCLPLKILGGDGAPARAILRRRK